MLDKDELTRDTLRMFKSEVQKFEIDNKETADDAKVLQIINKMIKQRKESADIFRTSDRLDLEKKENEEIKIIQKYMPVQIDDNKINSILDVAIEETGSAQIRDMGKVMTFLKDNYSGQMDFGKVSVMLKDKLKS